jgi:hypothetical protein
MEAIQEEIQASSTPRHVGRIPSKIASRFAYLTAAEWKSFGALFASAALRDRLENSRKYDLVCKLQKVCFLLECRTLTTDQVAQIHAAITDFCKLNEQIYGKTNKIAFHLIMHLRECILDFGPIHGFWLFAYERFNGILGNSNTNNVVPESTMMHSFLVQSELQERVRCMDLNRIPIPLRRAVSQLQTSESTTTGQSAVMAFDLCTLAAAWKGCDGSEQSENFGPRGEGKRITLTPEDKQSLIPYVKKKYPSLLSLFVALSPCAIIFTRFQAWGDQYGGWNSRFAKSSNVLVQWSIFGQDRVYPGRIKHFLQVETTIPTCSLDIMALGKRPTVGATYEEKNAIVCARDRMASERMQTVHTLAVIQWYKNVQLRSATGPVAPTPVILTRPDLLEDLWWKNRFYGEEHSVVPVAAIIGGFIQYPHTGESSSAAQQFRLIHIPRRMYHDSYG